MKKLQKNLENKEVLGVIAGIAEYFDTSPHNLRVVWTIITCLTGILPGLFIYMALAVMIPEPPIKK
jgi:phage shock protein PspC (stress-responsive transcriptional regulator)